MLHSIKCCSYINWYFEQLMDIFCRKVLAVHLYDEFRIKTLFDHKLISITDKVLTTSKSTYPSFFDCRQAVFFVDLFRRLLKSQNVLFVTHRSPPLTNQLPHALRQLHSTGFVSFWRETLQLCHIILHHLYPYHHQSPPTLFIRDWSGVFTHILFRTQSIAHAVSGINVAPHSESIWNDIGFVSSSDPKP